MKAESSLHEMVTTSEYAARGDAAAGFPARRQHQVQQVEIEENVTDEVIEQELLTSVDSALYFAVQFDP